jgi:hypothetical protein
VARDLQSVEKQGEEDKVRASRELGEREGVIAQAGGGGEVEGSSVLGIHIDANGGDMAV